MSALKEYENSVNRLETFCKELKNVKIDIDTNKYPIIVKVTCIPQQVMFEAEEDTEFETITVTVGLSTKVKTTGKLNIGAKDLSKITKLSEKLGNAYLHAFFEASVKEVVK